MVPIIPLCEFADKLETDSRNYTSKRMTKLAVNRELRVTSDESHPDLRYVFPIQLRQTDLGFSLLIR